MNNATIPFPGLPARAEKSPAKCEANKLLGYAKLMSDAGKHSLAAELMRQAKRAVAK